MKARKKTDPRPDIQPKKKGPRPLRDARLRYKITQRQCAEIFGISVRGWQQWEDGTNPPPPYWADLLKLKAPGAKNRG